MNRSTTLSLVVLVAAATPALAQLKISPANKHAWSENCGFLNFRDAGVPASAQGVRVFSNYLSGFAWGENIGWINLDDANQFIAITCPADIDGDGQVDLVDFFAFFNCWDVGGSCSEIDGVPGQDLGDFFAFFGSFDVGC